MPKYWVSKAHVSNYTAIIEAKDEKEANDKYNDMALFELDEDYLGLLEDCKHVETQTEITDTKHIKGGN